MSERVDISIWNVIEIAVAIVVGLSCYLLKIEKDVEGIADRIGRIEVCVAAWSDRHGLRGERSVIERGTEDLRGNDDERNAAGVQDRDAGAAVDGLRETNGVFGAWLPAEYPSDPGGKPNEERGNDSGGDALNKRIFHR